MNDERIQNWKERRATEAQAPVERQLLPDNGPGLDDARRTILERRDQRRRQLIKRILVLVAAPALAVLLYVKLFATPLYQGEAVFTVQTSANSAAAPNAGLFAITSANSTIADAFKARAFILSRPMMEHMAKRYGFLEHFEAPHMDPLTRYKGPFGLNQDPFRYYLKRVAVMVDVQEGIIRLQVEARTQEDAIRFGNAILAAAERHVNESSDKIGSDQIDALTRDVQQAERQVATARRSLAAVQARRGDLNPEQTAAAVYQLISNLELQLADAERQRDALRGEGLVNSPLLPGLDLRVRQLRQQIGEQRARLANPGGNSLSRTVGEYENALSRKEIAEARLQSTLNTLQQAYLNVIHERRYFVLIVGMSAGTVAKVRDLASIILPILFLLAIAGAIILAFRSGLALRAREAFMRQIRRAP